MEASKSIFHNIKTNPNANDTSYVNINDGENILLMTLVRTPSLQNT